jgi:hypothetical protein
LDHDGWPGTPTAWFVCSRPPPARWAAEDQGYWAGEDQAYQGWATLRRGFVERVTCPLGKWLDYGAEVVRHQPVTMVHCDDRTPAPRELYPGRVSEYRCAWVLGDASWAENRFMVPPVLFRRLRGGLDLRVQNVSLCAYDWPKPAHWYLGRACVEWAKAKLRQAIE